MEKQKLKKLIDVSAGREPADLVIRNCKIIDVYSGEITHGDIGIVNGLIAGIGNYEALEEVDADGLYAGPGLIDSHIHIESSYVTPEEISRLLVPFGTTTIIADPHEIVNVCGFDGLEYMLNSAEELPLSIKYMLPSCVPSTPYETSGANLGAKEMEEALENYDLLGIGEFMDFIGVSQGSDLALEKLLVAKKFGKTIDGHSPGLSGKLLNAYVAAGVGTDHECSTIEEMKERIAAGMFIQLREGSAAKNLEDLIKGVNSNNTRRCLLCSDDRQVKTIFEEGHLNRHLSICVESGISPIHAIQMASLNSSECYNLKDRGGIAPGKRADIVLFEDLKEFKAKKVFCKGKLVAEDGNYLLDTEKIDDKRVRGRIKLKDFSKDKLALKLNSDEAYVIDILPKSLFTPKGVSKVKRDNEGNFIFDDNLDVAKIAVVERHKGTGNIGLGLIRGYGIKRGALGLSIAHDSHNIICVGTNDEDMELVVNTLAEQEGGLVIACDNKVIDKMPLEIAGIMTNKSGEWVKDALERLHNKAHDLLDINKDIEPFMSLCFMSLPVIPEIKITDLGVFDLNENKLLKDISRL